MAVLKPKNANAAEGSILQITDGADLCCGDAERKHYATAEIDTTTDNIASINVTIPGGSAQTVALVGGAIDLSTPANTTTTIERIGATVRSLGYVWIDGGIIIDRNTGNADLVTIKVNDSSLVFNWIGTTTTFEAAFTATAAVP